MSLILIQPTDCYVPVYGVRSVFYLVAATTGCTFQWQTSTDNGVTFTNTSATSTFVNLASSSLQRNNLYRCIVTKGDVSEISNVVRTRIMPTGSEQISILIQNNKSENNKVTKDVELVKSTAGFLREQTSITAPELLVYSTLPEIAAANYLTIPDFHRSYFITDIVSISETLQRVYTKCDVLSSFADEIKANKGIVRRAESSTAFNLYINDNSLVAYQDPYILTEPFPAGFTGTAFILAVAGA